jgi:hypothetical protein
MRRQDLDRKIAALVSASRAVFSQAWATGLPRSRRSGRACSASRIKEDAPVRIHPRLGDLYARGANLARRSRSRIRDEANDVIGH